MRQGLRASAPARADRATAYRAPPQVWGPDQLKGWLSPYVAMGAGARDNRFGNLHAQTGSNTATTGNGPMAFSSLGDTFAGRRVVINGTVSGSTLTVNSVISGSPSDIGAGMAVLYDAWQANGSAATAVIVSGSGPYTLSSSPGNAAGVQITLVDRYLGLDGQPAFSRVPDPDDPSGQRMCWQHRLKYEDYRPSGQDDTSVGLQKCLARFGDSGSEASNGLGILQPVGTYYMDLFALRIPAATYLKTRFTAGELLLWQHKNNSGNPGIKISIDAGQARNNASTIPTGERIPLVTATEPRLTLSTYGNDGSSGWQSQTVIAANYPADTWIYGLMRARAQNLVGDNPHTQFWVKVGDAAASKVVDLAQPNCEASSNGINRQWGWYVGSSITYMNQTTGANAYIDGSGGNPGDDIPWWGAGEEILLLFKDYLVAPQWRADVEPPLWLVDRWFDQLRAR